MIGGKNSHIIMADLWLSNKDKGCNNCRVNYVSSSQHIFFCKVSPKIGPGESIQKHINLVWPPQLIFAKYHSYAALSGMNVLWYGTETTKWNGPLYSMEWNVANQSTEWNGDLHLEGWAGAVHHRR